MLAVQTKNTTTNEVSTVSVGYTVESNFHTNRNVLDFFTKRKSFLGFGHLSKLNTVEECLHIPPTEPFLNGAVMLLNGIGSEAGVDELTNRSHSNVVATADINTAYVGSATNLGTINKAESSVIREHGKKITYHMVFDFPTHAGNNVEINKIAFTNYPIQSTDKYNTNYPAPAVVNSTTGAYPYPTEILDQHLTNQYWQKGSYGEYFKYNIGADGTLFWVGSTHHSTPNPHIFRIWKEGKYSEAIVTAPTAVMNDIAKAYSEFQPFEVDGKWFLIAKCNTPNTISSVTYIEVTDLIWDDSVQKWGITLSDFKTAPLGSTVVAYALPKFCLTTDTHIAIFYASGNSNKEVLVVLDKQFKYVSHTTLTTSGTYSSYFNISQPFSYHYDPIKKGFHVFLQGRSYNANNTGFFVKEDFSAMEYSKNFTNLYDLYVRRFGQEHGWIMKNIANGASYNQTYDVGSGICYMAKTKLHTMPLIFHLDTPLYKTPDEVLKLTFDITIEI